MAGNPASPSSHPGVPTWARRAADWMFGAEGDTGFMNDAMIGQGMFPLQNVFGGLPGVMGAMDRAGPMMRQLSSEATQNAYTGSQQLAGGSLTGGQNVGWLNSLMPNMVQSATQYALGGVNPSLAAGRQSLQNVMNPTMYNPLFQNAAAAITPEINASFGSRGLGSSGPATQALSEAYQGLGNQFAQRQFQEQMQAQNQLGGLGLQASQLPGNVFGQFMQGAGMGQQALGQGIQNQLGPLGALGAGWENYMQGINGPLDVAAQVYQLSRSPMQALLQGIGPASGGVSTSQQGYMGKILGK